MDNNSIKQNILRIRLEHNLSQTEMADALGIARNTYRKLEKGRTRVISDYVRLIADWAGITPEEVVLGNSSDNGIAMLTEDRRGSGILGVLSVADNISIASLNKYVECGIVLNTKKIEQLVEENVEKMNTKTPSSKTPIASLSGGNQQKVLIGRWLANNPDVLILDEPTRGIDVGAKYEIYCIIADLAKEGKSIIMISSEMAELIGMSDRIMVMCDGRVTGFIDGKDATQENIMELATQFES